MSFDRRPLAPDDVGNLAVLGVDADSLTGAVRLYERVGFTVDYTRTACQKQLR